MLTLGQHKTTNEVIMWNYASPNYDNDPYFDGYEKNPEVAALQEKLDQCAVHFKKVLDMIYGSGELNLVELENELDEMTYYFDMKLIPGDLQIARSAKPFPIIDPLEYNKIFEDL